MLELYQKLIVDYSKATFQAKKPSIFFTQKRGWNRLCGDEINIYLSGEKSHPEVWYDCRGCALCKASCAILVATQNLKPAAEMIQAFQFFTSTDSTVLADPIRTLLTARKFPARLKCVTLAWQTLSTSLTDLAGNSQEDLYVTTE